MHYEIGYITFEGASGNARISAELLPTWLSNRPGTHIIYVDKVGGFDEMEAQRKVRKQALKEFAENILRAL